MSRFINRGCFVHGAMRAASVLVVLAGISVSLLPTPAEARPDSRSMTCDQARELVKKNGAVVMNTSPNTYDRYVYSRQYCVSIQQFLIRATVPTRDNKQCWIGYLCQEESPLFRGY